MKSREHNELNYTDRLKDVPKAMPALLRSSKVQSKAAKVGFDWVDVSGAFAKLSEELEEFFEAFRQDDAAARGIR